MQFYIVYGLALYLAPRRFIVPMLVALLLLCPLARLGASDMLAAQGWSALDAAYAIYAGPVLHFDIFAMGALLAFAQKAGLLDRMARPLALIGFTALILYFTFYVGVNHYVRNAHGSDLIRNIISGILIGEYREVTLYSALGLAMTGLVALAAKGDIWVRSVLQLRSLQYIGSISYGGYIFHQLGLKWATILLGTMGIITRQGGIAAHVAQLAIGLAITLMLAWLSFRWIETPARHLFSTTPAKNRLPTARYGSLEAS
jgi:peptidoglycan/LPS O-acetylase OafA/YrhL